MVLGPIAFISVFHACVCVGVWGCVCVCVCLSVCLSVRPKMKLSMGIIMGLTPLSLFPHVLPLYWVVLCPSETIIYILPGPIPVISPNTFTLATNLWGKIFHDIF